MCRDQNRRSFRQGRRSPYLTSHRETACRELMLYDFVVNKLAVDCEPRRLFDLLDQCQGVAHAEAQAQDVSSNYAHLFFSGSSER
jgi:hypothetical protein